MNRAANFAGCCLLLYVASSVTPAQELELPATPPPENLFLNGWMAELLEGKMELAREHYAKAAAKQLPNYQSEMALLRLREGHTDYPLRDEYREALANRGDYIALELNTYAYRRPLRGLNGRMSTALKNNDKDEIAKIRAELRTFLARNKKFNPRALMPQLLSKWRGEQANQTDPKLVDLKTRRRVALAAGNVREARQLWREIRLRQFNMSREGSRRLVANRWSEMTRLHLNGEHDRAIRMERYLESHGRRFRRSSDVHALVSRISLMKLADQETQLENGVMPRVKNLLGRSYLFADEKRVLFEVAARLDAYAKAGSWREGLLLAARIPYRAVLFR